MGAGGNLRTLTKSKIVGADLLMACAGCSGVLLLFAFYSPACVEVFGFISMKVEVSVRV